MDSLGASTLIGAFGLVIGLLTGYWGTVATLKAKLAALGAKIDALGEWVKGVERRLERLERNR